MSNFYVLELIARLKILPNVSFKVEKKFRLTTRTLSISYFYLIEFEVCYFKIRLFFLKKCISSCSHKYYLELLSTRVDCSFRAEFEKCMTSRSYKSLNSISNFYLLELLLKTCHYETEKI
jgi:hypothetical protein